MLWLHQSLPSFCSEVEQVHEALEDIGRADLMRADDDLVSLARSRQCLPSALTLIFKCLVVAKISAGDRLCFSCCCAWNIEWPAASCSEVIVARPKIPNDPAYISPCCSTHRNLQKLVKPQFFDYLQRQRERQEAIDAAMKWFSSRHMARASSRNADGDGDEEVSWGGQTSRGVLATEYMPCFRALKKAGMCESGIRERHNLR